MTAPSAGATSSGSQSAELVLAIYDMSADMVQDVAIRSSNAIIDVGVKMAFSTDRSKLQSTLKAQDPTLDALAKLAMGTLK
jgi:hypothetical protein